MNDRLQRMKADVLINAEQAIGKPITRRLFGKFSEHLGRNVYGGTAANVVENPWFEKMATWPDEAAVRRRIDFLADLSGADDLRSFEPTNIAPFWMTIHSAETSFCSGKRGNCLDVRTTAGESGVQTVVFLPTHRIGDYRLILRARGSVCLRCSVVTPAGDLLAEASYSLAVGDWTTGELALSINPANAPAAGDPLLLRIITVEAAQFSLDRCFLEPADAEGGWDKEIVEQLVANKLSLLRFPGGNFASGYHWFDGVGNVDARPILANPAWPIIEWNDVGTDEWLNLCEIVGCEPLICVNAGDGTAKEAADWVEYCNGGLDTQFGALRASNGHPEPYGVKLWEIGNELYGKWQIGNASAREYADRYLSFSTEMRERDPGINIIANGHTTEWNKVIMDFCGAEVRSLSVHTLENPGTFSPDDDPTAVYLEHMGFSGTYGAHLERLSGPMAAVGATPRLAVTELSIFTLISRLPTMDNMSEVLYYAGIIHAAICSKGLVELITHSALVNHSGGLAKQRGVVFPHPVWLAHRLYSTQECLQPLEVVVKSDSFETKGRWLPPAAAVPWIDVVCLRNTAGSRIAIFAINRSPDADIGANIRMDSYVVLSVDECLVLNGESILDRNSWDQSDKVTIVSGDYSFGENAIAIDLPPHSLVRLLATGIPD